MVKLVVELDEIDDVDIVLPRIVKQILDGYTSGYEPRWYLEEE